MLGRFSFPLSVRAEKKTWTEHTLEFDSKVREANLSLLSNFKDGEPIYLSYTQSSWGLIKFQHWFVTNRVHFLEFGSANIDIHTARVTINTLPRDRYPTECNDDDTRVGVMNEGIRSRMRHVLGMCNYSLFFRNCEHVANYVFRGRWISFQVELDQSYRFRYETLLTRVINIYAQLFQTATGNLNPKVFLQYLSNDQIRMVNTFPASIRPHIFNDESKKIYSFLNNNAIANRFEYYLDYEEETYNILILGPTGAGKSHLINTFFNRKICESEASHKSVTREVYFVRGIHKIYNTAKKLYEMRNIIIADTIGLCDTEWNEEKTLNLLKGRISSNFKYLDAVLVVFRADRLMPQIVENIKSILKWLNYNQKTSPKFIFIGTNADNLNDEKKKRMGKEVKDMLKLHSFELPTGEEVESVVYTGFPPEETLNESTKKRVNDCWDKLIKAMDNPSKFDRLPLMNRDGTFCNIL